IVISTRRTAIDLLRKRGRRSELLFGDEDFMDTMASYDPDPDDGLLREADEALLNAGLKRLPQRQRDLLNMKYMLNMDDPEIAETYGVKPDSIPSLLSRARRALKEALKELDNESFR
ncbi:MAG: sigma-70 family RNA polymerase sigma factor, partial [Eubacteriales bacterium]